MKRHTPWCDSRTQYPTGKPSEAYISLADGRLLEDRIADLALKNKCLFLALERIVHCNQDCSDKDAVIFMQEMAKAAIQPNLKQFRSEHWCEWSE